jgi:AcrR family transcriptional regulator
MTTRGRRTRERLLRAAEVVFIRDGFLDAKITDIAAEAGVSNGSFYTYFESKEAIFTTVIQAVIELMYQAAVAPHDMDRSPQARIEHVTREYLRAYQQHAGLMGILEQVATFNPGFREMRRDIRQAFRKRTESGIRRLQKQGLVDAALAPQCVAEALTSMVSNFCYVSMVLGEAYEEEEAVQTLTTIWLRGIGLVPVAAS